MHILIKNMGIIICAFYFDRKLHQKNYKYINLRNDLLLIFVLSIVSTLIENYSKVITLPIMFLLFLLIYLVFDYSDKLESNIIIISFALSYLFFGISVTITSFITLPFSESFGEKYNQMVSFALQMIIIHIPFKVKRIKKGMPFLDKVLYSLPAVSISFAVIAVAIVLNIESDSYYYIIPFIILLFLVYVFFINWRVSITHSYIEKANYRNIISLNTELQEKEEYIKKLEADNQRLSKIVHRDNKLVPSMERAVEKYLMEAAEHIALNVEDLSPLKNSDEIDKKGREILDELRKMTEDRAGLLDTTINKENKLPSVGIMRIDDLLEYMQQKASDKGILLHVTIDCDVSQVFDKHIDEETLCTLIADIIDNAIIATKYNDGGNILVDFSMIRKSVAVNVFDSGIPFTKEVLYKYGNEQYTTHKDDNGSGIGLMQMAEILDKCGASLFIDEFSQGDGLYTKKLSVVFNHKHQYVLYTARNDADITFLRKRADLTIVKK